MHVISIKLALLSLRLTCCGATLAHSINSVHRHRGAVNNLTLLTFLVFADNLPSQPLS